MYRYHGAATTNVSSTPVANHMRRNPPNRPLRTSAGIQIARGSRPNRPLVKTPSPTANQPSSAKALRSGSESAARRNP